MQKRNGLLYFAKRAFACIMAATTLTTFAADGLTFHKEQNVAFATGSVLSSSERGVIYANSRTDFRDETIYFLITTRFYDGDPSNNARTSEDAKANNPESDPSWRGDFAGLIDKLDYIKALGFTAIWITPVVQNNSGYDYHGYHAYNFNAVDNRYESNGITYQDLIDAVHAKGMKIIQDVVFNHTCNFGEENLNQLGGTALQQQISSNVYSTRNQVVMNGTGDPNNIYHHNGFCGGGDWDNFEAQRKTIADDCFDLNTENPVVYNYLVDCYKKYINMGVDGFRVDTVKHISRLTLNSVFVPAFKAAGGDKFYMFGEICTKGHDVWYRGNPPISTAFYTWADDASWLGKWSSTDQAANNTLVEQHYNANCDTGSQPTSNNAFLNGNEYHTPDYSKRSGMDAIDFQMHWSFNSANGAFSTALGEDQYFNDATWNVVYVDSHDYGPDECQTLRYNGGTDAWAENLSLMFTFRGIPCVYYGSEIEFQAGKPIDVGPNAKLSETGRAYYGDNIEGTVTATDFTVFGNVSGQVAETLNKPLSQHIMRLNRLRQAIPALRKGQYSTEGCSGNIAFKRRYTDANTDSFALVAISGNATFSGIPNGTYTDAVTGDVKTVTNGTLSANVSGKGNMKIYVLSTSKTPAPGRVIPNGDYLTDGGAAEKIGGESINVVNPTGITLSTSSVSVMEGNSASVTATVAPSNATNKSVTWSTSNANVATVSGGTITGVAAGSATITAKTSNGLSATVKVTVTANPNVVKPTGISLNNTSLTITAGNTASLAATVAPSNATNKTVTWSTADSSVATVSNTGLVTAVAEGTTTITASTFNGYKATATITVEPIELPVIQNGVYFEKPSDWGSNIKVYFFANDQTVGASWPGTAMTDLGGGIYGYEYGTAPSGLKVIFNDGSHQTANLDYVNNGYYNSSGYVKTITSPTGDTGRVIVKYVNEAGTEIASGKTLTGKVGSAYSTSAASVTGYTLKTTPSNASGTYTKEDITVRYVYYGSAVVTTGNVAYLKLPSGWTNDVFCYAYDSATEQTNNGEWPGQKMTLDSATGYYKYEVPSNIKAPRVIFYNSNTNRYPADQQPGLLFESDGSWIYDGSTWTKYTVAQSELSASLKVNNSTSALTLSLGDTVNLSVTASGGSGSYKYKYVVHNLDTDSYYCLKDNSTSSSYSCSMTSAGNKEFLVGVTDSSGYYVKTAAIKVTVPSAAVSGRLTINGSASSLSVNVGDTITLAATASGGSGSYKYKYVVHNLDTNEWFCLKDNSTSSNYSCKITGAGNKEFVVGITDSKGSYVKTQTIKVTAKATSTTALKASLSVNGYTSGFSAQVGTSVKLSVNASGGSGSYKYKYVVHNLDTNEWYCLKDNSTSNSYTCNLTSAGNKEFVVAVTDTAGNYVKTSSIKVTITSGSSAALTAKLTVNGSTGSLTATVGTSVKLSVSASGGSGSYKYKYVVHNLDTNEWYCLKDNSTSNSYTCKLTAAGNKEFVVAVTDTAGNYVKTSSIKVKATK